MTIGQKLENAIRKITRRFPPDFGKNPPWVAYVVFIPVFAAQIAIWIERNGWGIGLAFGILAGIALWTLDEYLMHRYAFHGRSAHAAAQVFNSTLHMLHHQKPSDMAFVAAPMVLCIPSYALIFGALWAVAGLDLALTAGGGLILGFLYYEWVHFATHHVAARTPWMRALKKHHMSHHFVDQDQFFGVTSPLWDHAFGTMGTLGRRSKGVVAGAPGKN